MLTVADFPPEDRIDRVVAESLRSKTGRERMAIFLKTWTSVRDSIEFRVRREHPDWSDAEVRTETGRRMLAGSQ